LALAQTKMGLINSNGEAKDYLTGIDYYKNGLRMLPSSTHLLYNYACFNERLGNYLTAIQFYNFVLKLKQNDVNSLYG
jgi:tetratricopeptide (TPR) repeat protein